jgi:hypothetical protein
MCLDYKAGSEGQKYGFYRKEIYTFKIEKNPGNQELNKKPASFETGLYFSSTIDQQSTSLVTIKIRLKWSFFADT